MLAKQKRLLPLLLATAAMSGVSFSLPDAPPPRTLTTADEDRINRAAAKRERRRLKSLKDSHAKA